MIMLVCWGEYWYFIRSHEIDYFTLNIHQNWAPWWPADGTTWPEQHFQYDTRQLRSLS